jgi:hypothetical protein
MADFITPPRDKSELPGFYQELCRIVNKKRPAIPDDSEEVSYPTVAEFNALLAALRTAFE